MARLKVSSNDARPCEIFLKVNFTNGLVFRAGFKWFARKKLIWLTYKTVKTVESDLIKLLLERHDTCDDIMSLRADAGMLKDTEKSDVPAEFKQRLQQAVDDMRPVWQVSDLGTAMRAAIKNVGEIKAYEFMWSDTHTYSKR